MKFEISIDTIKQTTNCHCDFDCLNDNENPTCCDDNPLCPVTSEIEKNMLHIDFNNDYNCSYKLNFVKAGFICSCPVRYEIYKRYEESRKEMQNKSIIVLAEDDVGHAGLILKSLKDAGITNDILCFENGENTLDFLFKRGSEPYREEGVPYVLLLDIRLPGINGIEVLRQIKKDKWVNNIPVIMLSVSDNPEEIEQCRRFGCDNYFVKQTTFEKFSLTVEKVGHYINKVVLPEIANI